jgi:hypothetical protein
LLAKISDFFFDISSGRIALLALLIFLLFGALVLPRQAALAEQISGGAGSPDTTLFYSTEDLYNVAKEYGQEGRRAYIRSRYSFDVAFPLVYGFFLVTAISWFAVKLPQTASKIRLVNLAPLIGVLFDFFENAATSIVMLRYPAKTALIASIAPIISILKWVFVYGSFLILSVLIIYWILGMIRQKNTP